jgi:alpha-beta hydrolase superfamily lysophospholipase
MTKVQPVMWFLLLAGALYAALVALVYVFQGRLLYLPSIGGRDLHATPGDIGLAFEDVRFTTRDGVSLHGWFVPAQDAERVLLFCHGNAGNISHRLDSIRIFHELGLSVFIFDFRGYGLSAGQPTEDGTYADAEAAWNYLTDTRRFPDQRVVIYGHSLGAAIAAQVARGRRAAALILESPFASVTSVASHHYRFLPVRWLSRFEYATALHVRDVHVPVLIIHSRQDEIIPVEQGREVFEHANEPKSFLEISGDHNAGFLLSGVRYTEGLRTFLRAHASVQAAHE